MNQPLPSDISVTDIERIAAIQNRVIRNLEITQCYTELSAAMSARLAETPTWCTFATWASRQAGSTIRGEDLLDRFQRRLGHRSWLAAPLESLSRILLRKGLFEPDSRFGRVVAEIHTPFDAFERASDAVASGNLKVFEEIGLGFARFLATVPDDATVQSGEFAVFVAGFRPGPPPDGQDYLTEAFAHYQDARRETDAAVRAAWILLANLKIGLHEQMRLQSQIAAGVDAPLTTAADLGARVLHALVPGSRRWPSLVHRPAERMVGWMASRVRRAAVKITREAVTESQMVLALPTGVVALAGNLDVPVPAVFAGTLPSALAAFVAEYDPCPPGTSQCAATDWTDLRQRMHYILHLFRAFAEQRTLFTPPFNPDQVTSFRAGRIPGGNL